MDPDPLDEFLQREFERHELRSDDERAGLLLTIFSSAIEKMNREELTAFRVHLLKRFPSGDEQTAVIEVIDGQLAVLNLSSTKKP